MGCKWGAKMWHVYFLETDFTGQMDFTAIQYSAIKNGLPSNNQFCFQGNAAKVNHIWESMCNIFVQMYILGFPSVPQMVPNGMTGKL
jgi:hypothetical protein